VRCYYITRNYTVMLRETGRHPLGLWALKGLLRSLKQGKRILLYEQGKREKLAALRRGWWDGLHGRMGPYRPRG
jgi:hypothetical protein